MSLLPGWLEPLFVLLLVLLVAAAFFGAVKAVVSVLVRAFRGGPGRDREGPPVGRRAGRGRPGPVRCPDRKCRKVNVGGARFCARCGRPLRGSGTAATDGMTP